VTMSPISVTPGDTVKTPPLLTVRPGMPTYPPNPGLAH
jgi:hypothetical protein